MPQRSIRYGLTRTFVITDCCKPIRVPTAYSIPSKIKLIVIKGNCDSEVDTLISEFDFSDFSQIFVDDLKITLTHGHKFNKDNMPTNAGDLMCYGHFHTGFIKR